MKRDPLPQTMLIRKESASQQLYQKWGGIYLIYFIILIFVFACGYYVGNLYSSGIELTYTSNDGASFTDCFYFSIVTISSLGYGDIRPVGFGRVLAGLEVICGLAIIGVWISHLASRKAEIYLKRMHDHAVDERFKMFRINIKRLFREFQKLVNEYIGNGEEFLRLFPSGLDSTNSSLDELFVTVDGVTRYLRYEVKNRFFFDTVGVVPFGRLLGVLTDIVEQLGISANSLVNSSCTTQKLAGNFLRIRQIMQRIEVIARCAQSLSPDQGHQTAGGQLLVHIDNFYKVVTERPK